MERFLLQSFLLLGLIGMHPDAYASDELEDLLALPLEELTKLKLTTSTMMEESLRSVPAAMTVFTREEIRRLGFTDLQQLAVLVPGFQVGRVDTWGIGANISNRGRSSSDGIRSVLILIDGQRLNNDSNGTGFFNDIKIPLDNADRVEFIRGPGSAIYGTNAMTAVINIITRSEREIRAEIGNPFANEGSAQWRYDTSSGHLELFARGLAGHGNPQNIFNPAAPASPTATHDPYRGYDLSFRATSGELSFSGRFAQKSASQFYIHGYVDNDRNERIANSNNVYLDWNHRFGNTVSLRGSSWINQRKLRVSTNAGLPLEGELDERALGTQWVLQQDQGSPRWLIGWEWRKPKITRNLDSFGDISPTNSRRIIGLFAQYQTYLTSRLALTAGLRHDDYSDSGRHCSPRLGLVFEATSRDSLKLLYSDAFRAPSRIETTISTAGLQGNLGLKPETAKTTELIWLHLFNRGSVSATLFNTKVQNAIVETVTSDIKRTWINSSSRLVSRGLELEAQYRWQNWHIRLAASRLFKVDNPSSSQSRNLLSGSLGYSYGLWNLSVIGSYHSGMSDPNEQDGDIRTTEYSHIASSALWGIHLSKKIGDDLELYLHGENIFDRKVLYPANYPRNYVGVPERGRLITAGFRWLLN